MPSIYQPLQRSSDDTARYNQLRQTAGQKVQAGLERGYTPSQRTSQSLSKWQQTQAAKPAAYKSSYSQQLDDLLNDVMSRAPFTYDVNADALYQQARDQYMLNGRQAMRDTIGQASTMTGGYGNSYAATAGNQAYQQYLTQLAGMIPDFYDRAYQRYQDQGDAQRQNYAMLADRENQDYARYRDTRGDWEGDVDRAMQEYNLLYNQDYSRYTDEMAGARDIMGQMEDMYQADRAMDYQAQRDNVSDQHWQAEFDRANADTRQQYAYKVAMALLSEGKMPSAEELAAAGLSPQDAQLFIDIWNRDHPAPAAAPVASSGGGGGGGGGGGSGSASSSNKGTNTSTWWEREAAGTLDGGIDAISGAAPTPPSAASVLNARGKSKVFK